ncbi:ATP-binding protein [Kitasatospora sp. KL5]|uniref:ATP-binding protein n=1 Tax=Kitasatospora sp. KL5 TaxID=3425125 RepID=UPI003D6DD82B
MTLPAVPESVPQLRRTARALVRSRRLSPDVAEALSVIVTELATNVVLHSGSPDVSVLFEVCDTALTVRVRDTGRWRERPTPRCEPADVDAAFGRGLDLVDAFAVDTTVLRTAGGTLVEAVIAL